jgi:hypothetical protein
MDSSTQAITPLRQRMIDDMRMRKLADKTQSHYIRAVRQFAGFLGRSPDTASVEVTLPWFHVHQIVCTFLMNGGRDGQKGVGWESAIHR